jgi:hypothetical protein
MKDELIFNKQIHLNKDHIFAIEISPRNEQVIMVEDRKEMMVKQVHSILGHMNRLQTLETRKMWMEDQRIK